MAKSRKKPAVKKAAGFIKLKAINNLSGKYLLPYSAGQTFTIDEKRAKELIDNNDAEKTK